MAEEKKTTAAKAEKSTEGMFVEALGKILDRLESVEKKIAPAPEAAASIRNIPDTYEGPMWEEMEEITVPYVPGQPDIDKFISVNGRRYQIRRGETVSVPRAVAEAYRNSEQQSRIAEELKRRLAAEAREKKI